MKQIIILGAGSIGKEIAIALFEEYDISCADIQLCSLELLTPQYPITVIPCDFRNKSSLRDLVRTFDLVINASSASTGYETLKTIVESGKNVINLSYVCGNLSAIEKTACKNNTTAVIISPDDSQYVSSTLSTVSQFFDGKITRKGILHYDNDLITV